MANIFLAWQNRVDEGTLSGGSWNASLPLTNLQNRQVQKVARSTNATVASTQFAINLGQAQAIGVVALVVHNISVSGYYRVSGSDAAISNRLLDSVDFTSANWLKYGSAQNVGITVTANIGTAPDNTVTADQVVVAAIGAAVTLRQAITSTTAAVQFSVYVRQTAGTARTCTIDVGNSGTVQSTSAALSSNWTKITCAGSVTAATWVDIAFSGTGTFEVWDAELYNGSGLLYDSGWAAVWPSGVIPQSLLEWEDDNFWLGTLSASARAGYQSPLIHKLAATQTLQHWNIELADTSNSSGYVQIGRLFMARGWTPGANYSYGASLGFKDPTPIEISLSGAEFFDVRSKYRVMNFALQYITKSEAYDYALQLQRLAGISGEILVVPDSDDTTGIPIRAFVGRLLQIGAVRQPQPTTYNVDFEVKELL